MSKHKKIKFPKTALAFYIKLYCKRKGSSKTKYQSNLVEATQSWLSLSETEKQQINTIYKESEHKFKMQCLNQLKNAETFMKIKHSTGLTNVDLNESCSIIQEPKPYTEDVTLQTQTEHVEEIVNDEDKHVDSRNETLTENGLEHHQEEHNGTISEPIDANEHISETFLVEPVPPTLKSSKDLFHLLNLADEGNSVTWTTLPTFEKIQYRRAVYLLKKDYITKYKEYLLSLSPKELFDYYNKTIF